MVLYFRSSSFHSRSPLAVHNPQHVNKYPSVSAPKFEPTASSEATELQTYSPHASSVQHASSIQQEVKSVRSIAEDGGGASNQVIFSSDGMNDHTDLVQQSQQ